MPLKQSILQYRTIAGMRYKCFTSNVLVFDELKQQCKQKSIKFRIINTQFYIEESKINKVENIWE